MFVYTLGRCKVIVRTVPVPPEKGAAGGVYIAQHLVIPSEILLHQVPVDTYTLLHGQRSHKNFNVLTDTYARKILDVGWLVSSFCYNYGANCTCAS